MRGVVAVSCVYCEDDSRWRLDYISCNDAGCMCNGVEAVRSDGPMYGHIVWEKVCLTCGKVVEYDYEP